MKPNRLSADESPAAPQQISTATSARVKSFGCLPIDCQLPGHSDPGCALWQFFFQHKCQPIIHRFPALTLAEQRPTCHFLHSCLLSTKISQSSGTGMPGPFVLPLPFPFPLSPFPPPCLTSRCDEEGHHDVLTLWRMRTVARASNVARLPDVHKTSQIPHQKLLECQ